MNRPLQCTDEDDNDEDDAISDSGEYDEDDNF